MLRAASLGSLRGSRLAADLALQPVLDLWGIANVLYGVCVLRIGAALTGAVLSGLGVAAGVTLPMILKGSGIFSKRRTSPQGRAGDSLWRCGDSGRRRLSTQAGFGRDRVLQKDRAAARASGGFLLGLIMAVAAGILSAGLALGFVYTYKPIVTAVIARGGGDDTGEHGRLGHRTDRRRRGEPRLSGMVDDKEPIVGQTVCLGRRCGAGRNLGASVHRWPWR